MLRRARNTFIAPAAVVMTRLDPAEPSRTNILALPPKRFTQWGLFARKHDFRHSASATSRHVVLGTGRDRLRCAHRREVRVAHGLFGRQPRLLELAAS